MDTKALDRLHYGLYIVSSAFEGKLSGQIANSIMQITSDPVVLAVSLSKKNFTYEIVEKSKKFAITALSQETPFEFIGKFGFKTSKDFDKFQDTNHTLENGIPVITENATAVYELETIDKVDINTHVIFLAKVTNMKVINSEIPTMTYEYYKTVKGGKTAKNAPTFQK